MRVSNSNCFLFQGVIPATVGIVGGHILVGMTKDDIHELAQETENPGHKLVKVSRRDLPYVLSNKMSGGTTVAATMMIAHKVFELILFC